MQRNVDRIQSKQNLLGTLTHSKKLGELGAAVEKSRSDEQVKLSVLELEKTREAKLKAQLAACKIVAAVDGLVLHATDPARSVDSGQSQVEEGMPVRERQKILSIADLAAPMRVNAKVPEALVSRVTPGLRARIRIEAFEDATFSGVVATVNRIPDPPVNTDQLDPPGFTPRSSRSTTACPGSAPGCRPRSRCC